MKAAILKEQKAPLVIEEVSTPQVGENEVLVKVVACGVCHSDLHYIDHGISTFKKPPIILGHEASGIVEESGTPDFEVGDRVLLPAVFSCGECDYCKSGRDNICRKMIMLGNSIDGAYAQYIKVPAQDVLLMPDEIPLEEGCIIADAISTPYHAVVNRAKVKPGQRVLVVGCGGVGINVVQIASLLGAEVIAYDIDPVKLEMAMDLGAKFIVNPNETDLKEFLKQNGGFVDVALEVIGKPETIEIAYKSIGISGKLCVIGYTNQNISINPAKIMFFEQEIIGSIGCPPKDYPKIMSLVVNERINIDKLIANRYPLEDINKALDELRESKVLRNIILPNGKIQDPLHPSN
ncbi:MAG: zinc-binding dehydrogenase [Anaerotruncus sp.]|nr:zinc-binding dehydrogenase [Anaerotruncus sp.]